VDVFTSQDTVTFLGDPLPDLIALKNKLISDFCNNSSQWGDKAGECTGQHYDHFVNAPNGST
jgi:hypothetical protein